MQEKKKQIEKPEHRDNTNKKYTKPAHMPVMGSISLFAYCFTCFIWNFSWFNRELRNHITNKNEIFQSLQVFSIRKSRNTKEITKCPSNEFHIRCIQNHCSNFFLLVQPLPFLSYFRANSSLHNGESCTNVFIILMSFFLLLLLLL